MHIRTDFKVALVRCLSRREADCGIPSRLVPPLAVSPPPCRRTRSDGSAHCRLDEVSFEPISDKLQLDTETSRAPRRVANASLVPVLPTPLHATKLLLLATDSAVAELLGLDAASWRDGRERSQFTELFTGRKLFPGSIPYSHVYGGHQFGSWSGTHICHCITTLRVHYLTPVPSCHHTSTSLPGQLGDGRAISLGELRGLEVSLKGSGKTPLSRAGDGRAVLQSLCREFLGGAALVALGVPSTRALAVIGSDHPSDAVLRDEWYTGQASRKRAGVLVRVAPTFLRFGSFELAAKRQGVAGVLELARFALRKLASVETEDDASVAYLHRAQLYGGADGVASEIKAQCFFGAYSKPTCAATVATELDPEPVLRCLLRRVVERCAALVAAWTAVGFAHGVMNTDNMSILCLSLDLNVYGFMEQYNEGYVPNKIDDEGRYAFGSQVEIMRWNLMRLASALGGTSYPQDYESDRRSWSKAGQLDGFPDRSGWLSASARAAQLNAFDGVYSRCLEARRRLRLGLPPNGGADRSDQQGQRKSDSTATAVAQWVEWMSRSRADVTLAHRALTSIPVNLLITALEKEQNAARTEQGPALLAIVQHIESAAGVSVNWSEENQESSAQAIHSLIAALSRSLSPSSSPTSESADDSPAAAWQKHVVAMNPSLTLRTEALREVTTFAAENTEHGSATLQAMLEQVKNPYGGSCVDETCSSWRLDAVTKAVDKMRGFPKANQPQTSCGGQ
eukprot:COSAG02_NODE_225_length_28184_cov_16.570981_9_plen_737_part_00